MERKVLFLLAFFCFASFSFADKKPKYLTYEQFGAYGDGVHEDQEAIAATHRAANEMDVPVHVDGTKTYRIGPNSKTIVVQTDVDFSNAKFIIDDVGTSDRHTENIFRIESRQKPIPLEGVTSLKKGQKELGITLPERSLVYVCDKNHAIYIRYGLNQNNGTAQQEVFVADKKGRIEPNGPIVWNYNHISSIIAYPVDKKKLTIRGGHFLTIANQAESRYNYRNRGIIISRSNVLVENLEHKVEGELDHGAPYAGFIDVHWATDVVIKDCMLCPHFTYTTIGSAGKPVQMGSYDLQAAHSVGVLFRNIRQSRDIDDTRYWGLFASNFCKDLRLEGCCISRFDAHMGVANVTLRKCTFGHMGVRMVGFGTINLEDCEIHHRDLVSLREDYGSSWEGDLVVKNCTLMPRNPNIDETHILSGNNNGKHDFGYLCHLPNRITIKGLRIVDGQLGEKYKGPRIFSTFGRNMQDSNLLPYDVKGQVIVKGLKAESGKPLQMSSNTKLFKNMELQMK